MLKWAVMWSEIPSGMCAKIRTMAASNNRDHARNLSYYCLLALDIWWCYSSRTFRSWWIKQSTQHYQRGCNNIPSFLQQTTPIACSLCEGWTPHDLHILVTTPFCWHVSHCNTQARTVNLIHTILCDDEGVTQAHGCLRHEIDRGFERWHCTIYCLDFCAGFNDAKRQHLSTINTNSDLSFTTIQKQTSHRKQSMDQSDDKLAHGTTDEESSSKIPRGHKYIHRKASRKMHSMNSVNIESRVTYNTVWTCERFVPSRMAQWAVYYKALVPVHMYMSI